MFTRVPEFLPSQSGFHFLNNYPQGTPYPVVNLPVIGPLNLGDAGNGLCGGFVMARERCTVEQGTSLAAALGVRARPSQIRRRRCRVMCP